MGKEPTRLRLGDGDLGDGAGVVAGDARPGTGRGAARVPVGERVRDGQRFASSLSKTFICVSPRVVCKIDRLFGSLDNIFFT